MKEFKFLGEWYRFGKHHGSELIEIERMEKGSKWGFGAEHVWRRLYFGHAQPLETALAFFKENPKTPK